MLGQGSLGLVSKNAINQWWVRRRGVAMGITGMATALLGSGTFPALVTWMISSYGWRVSYILLGCAVLAIMVPLGFIFIRNRPEDYGLQPDGHASDDDKSETAPFEDNWTLNEAIKTPTFWIISASIGSMSALSTGMTFHFFSIFEDSGLSSAVAASVFLPIAAVGAAVEFAGGIPNEDRQQFRDWSDRLVQVNPNDPASVEDATNAALGLYGYFTPMLAARRANRKDDLMSA